MTKLPIEFHPEARAEADATFDHYLASSPAIALAFVESLDKARSAIQDYPDTWAVYLYGTHRYLLGRFPFVIVYRATERCIEIVAVAHGHREPGYWRSRP